MTKMNTKVIGLFLGFLCENFFDRSLRIKQLNLELVIEFDYFFGLWVSMMLMLEFFEIFFVFLFEISQLLWVVHKEQLIELWMLLLQLFFLDRVKGLDVLLDW